METTVSYSLEIKDEYRCFYDTVDVYQEAVSFLVSVVSENYGSIESAGNQQHRQRAVEKLVHATEGNEARYKAFDIRFHKLPSYFRRSAISAALGAVESHRRNLELWEESGRKCKKPRLKVDRNAMPVFFKGNMFTLSDDGYRCSLKLRIRNDWIWKSFRFRKADLAYLEKKGLRLENAMSPVLKKKGKRFALCFSFRTESELAETKKRILSCDIGINNAAVMSVMEEDGTVIARRFASFPVEEDRLSTILHEIRKAHSASRCMTHRLNRYANNYNEALSIKTSSAIAKIAEEFHCDAIVMENLRKQKGKKYGTKAMRLALWRKRDIAERVKRLAHASGIRFSTVCAYQGSREPQPLHILHGQEVQLGPVRFV